jgi:hypothetical protein
MVLCGSALFAQPLPVVNEIPIYPGGALMLEIRMTDKLIMPGIASLMKMSDSYAEKAKAPKPGASAAKKKETPVDPAVAKAAVKDLQTVLSGLKELHIVLYSLPEKTAASSVACFYTTEMKLDSGWNKLFETNDSNIAARVMERQSKDGIFCFGTFNGKVLVVRTTGSFNSAQMSGWLNKYGGDLIGVFMNSGLSGKNAEQPTATKKPSASKP